MGGGFDYFAYGSNLLPTRLLARAPSARLLRVGELRDFRLTFHKRGADGSGKCDVVPARGGIVYGAVYRLTEPDLFLLDDFEGPGYTRIGGAVLTAQGNLPVQFYRAKAEAIDDTLSPYDWYLQLVLAGARQLNLNSNYVRRIAKVSTIVDPDLQRAATHQALLRR